ncbi:MAG: class I SAM-dependent methyltransferase [Bacteroidetes bacterium]|nr:class I SAM-dependent methyltransferase [Bacteroidota bacterium]
MNDHAGYETLVSISHADKFNTWMYQCIQGYAKGNILEIGSGLGNISTLFVKDGARITLSDIDKDYLEHLRVITQGYENVKGITEIDLQRADFTKHYSTYKEQFDTIFLLNVLEHLEDDETALENLNFILKPSGTLIILVPAYSGLFSELDKQLGHYRRYTSQTLCKKIAKRNYKIEKSFYFNLMGIPAWIYGKIRHLHTVPGKEMKIYNWLVPFGKILDTIFFNKAGLSVIAIARKNYTVDK